MKPLDLPPAVIFHTGLMWLLKNWAMIAVVGTAGVAALTPVPALQFLTGVDDRAGEALRIGFSAGLKIVGIVFVSKILFQHARWTRDHADIRSQDAARLGTPPPSR